VPFDRGRLLAQVGHGDPADRDESRLQAYIGATTRLHCSRVTVLAVMMGFGVEAERTAGLWEKRLDLGKTGGWQPIGSFLAFIIADRTVGSRPTSSRRVAP
jgi:hypothetical protein